MHMQEVNRDALTVAAANGNTPEAQELAANALDQGEFNWMRQTGFVSEGYRGAESAHLQDANLLNAEGHVNRNAVDSIERWRKFSRENPTLSKHFYDPEALSFARVVDLVAGVNGNVAEAIQTVHKQQLDNKIASKGMSIFLKSEDTVAEVNETADKWLEQAQRGLLQAAAHSDVDIADVILVTSDEERGRERAIEAQVIPALTLQLSVEKSLQPNVDADLLTPAAQTKLLERSAFLGDSWVMVDYDIMDAALGTYAQNYQKEGLPHEMLVHYFAERAKFGQHQELTEIGALEFVPMWMKPNSILGFDVNLAQGMGPWNSIEAQNRGMRTFSAHKDNLGDINIRAYLETGLQSEPVAITKEVWRDIGDFWRHTHPNVRTDWEGDPVLNPVKPREAGTIFDLFSRQPDL